MSKGRSLEGSALLHLLVCFFVVGHDNRGSVARVREEVRSLRSNLEVDDAAQDFDKRAWEGRMLDRRAVKDRPELSKANYQLP